MALRRADNSYGGMVVPGAPTYAAYALAQSSYATPTDLFSLQNQAALGSGKIIQVRAMAILAGSTSASLIAVRIYKRTALNTGGSPSAVTATKYYTNDPAPVGVAQIYTAAPTITDANGLVNQIKGSTGTLTLAPGMFGFTSGGAAGGFPILNIDMGEPITLLPQEELAMNLAGIAVPSGFVFDAMVSWIES